MTHSKALGELLGRVVFHWLLLSSETLDNQAAGQPGSLGGLTCQGVRRSLLVSREEVGAILEGGAIRDNLG